VIDKPVFIIKGLDYDRGSGGIRALHELAKMLSDRGEKVTMPYCKPRYELPAVSIEDPGPYILILPEVMEGVCPDADLTVRWLLNAPGKSARDTTPTWGKNDLLFHFEDHFAYGNSRPLCVPHVDEGMFHNKENLHDKCRDIDLFYSHKANFHGSYKKIPNGAIDISQRGGTIKKGDWEALALLFRRCKTLYTMEETATTLEAALCGAKIEYVLSDYLPTLPPVVDHIEQYQKIKERSAREVDDFISFCYKKAGISLWRHTVKVCA